MYSSCCRFCVGAVACFGHSMVVKPTFLCLPTVAGKQTCSLLCMSGNCAFQVYGPSRTPFKSHCTAMSVFFLGGRGVVRPAGLCLWILLSVCSSGRQLVDSVTHSQLCGSICEFSVFLLACRHELCPKVHVHKPQSASVGGPDWSYLRHVYVPS